MHAHMLCHAGIRCILSLQVIELLVSFYTDFLCAREPVTGQVCLAQILNNPTVSAGRLKWLVQECCIYYLIVVCLCVYVKQLV